MSLEALINRTGTLTRRTPSSETDRYGDEIPGEVASEIVCEIQQTSRNEDGDETGDAHARAFFLPGTPIGIGDALTVDGEAYEVLGDPWHVRNPRTGTVSHIEASLRRTAGPEDAS